MPRARSLTTVLADLLHGRPKTLVHLAFRPDQPDRDGGGPFLGRFDLLPASGEQLPGAVVPSIFGLQLNALWDYFPLSQDGISFARRGAPVTGAPKEVTAPMVTETMQLRVANRGVAHRETDTWKESAAEGVHVSIPYYRAKPFRLVPSLFHNRANLPAHVFVITDPRRPFDPSPQIVVVPSGFDCEPTVVTLPNGSFTVAADNGKGYINWQLSRDEIGSTPWMGIVRQQDG